MFEGFAEAFLCFHRDVRAVPAGRNLRAPPVHDLRTRSAGQGGWFPGRHVGVAVGPCQGDIRQRFWDAVRAEELPAEVRYLVFDAAAASGVLQSTL